jgi:hypothetical protein
MESKERAMSDKVAKLAELIEKEISYDASGFTPEKRCPHCNEVIQKQETWGYWIDHRGVLAQAIIDHLGLGSSMREAMDSKLGEIDVTGNKKKDALTIAQELLT